MGYFIDGTRAVLTGIKSINQKNGGAPRRNPDLRAAQLSMILREPNPKYINPTNIHDQITRSMGILLIHILGGVLNPVRRSSYLRHFPRKHCILKAADFVGLCSYLFILMNFPTPQGAVC